MHAKVVSGVITPSERPATAVTILKTEHGWYAFSIACCGFSSVMLFWNTSPVWGA